jgi:hypothetical protein
MATNAYAIPTTGANRPTAIGGWTLTGLTAAFMLMDAVMHVLDPAFVTQAFVQLGYPAALARPLGVVELLCVIAYLVPETAVLGAVLLTGYLGGATAVKVRLEDPWFLFAIAIAVLIWGGLWLRDRRVRALLPVRR